MYPKNKLAKLYQNNNNNNLAKLCLVELSKWTSPNRPARMGQIFPGFGP
jgi:hypothetical protein